jgi:hypothetical protein
VRRLDAAEMPSAALLVTAESVHQGKPGQVAFCSPKRAWINWYGIA